MEKLISCTEKLLESIIEMHPNLNMGDPKQEKLYLAYHDCKNEIKNLKI